MSDMKIAYLTTEDLYGAINSGSLQCSFGNMKLLEKLSGKEKLLHVFLGDEVRKLDECKFEYKRVEGKICKLLLSMIDRRFLFPHTEEKVINIVEATKPDVVFYEGPYWAFVIKKLRKKIPNATFILFMHNIEKVYYKNLINKSNAYKILYKVTCKCEELSIRCADKIICLNERDSNQLLKIYNREADLLLPIHMKDQFNEEKVRNSKGDKTLLFVGSLFPPNYDGVKWLIENVMEEIPEYKLIIVGRNFENVTNELERENVKVVGSVENLQDYYYEYPVLVMPILYGAGMKVKTAEALMYGKTIIGSAEALEGYNTKYVEGIYECNTKAEYIETIRKIFQNDKYKETQQQVRKLFLKSFESGQVYENFSAGINKWLLERK